MICSEYRDSIGLLVDGELSDDAAMGVRAHLAVCDPCRELYESEMALVADLSPKEREGMTLEESRFWRRFDHELALRAARGEAPFWTHSIALPFPLAVLTLGVFVFVTFAALSSHKEVREMHARQRILEASLKQLQEDSLFPKRSSTALAGVEAISTPVGRAAGTPVAGGGRLVAPSEMRAREPQLNIRFVDSDGVIQPGDLY